ncbi:MAG: SRPBCC family protein [Pseudomonadota bacterium]
MEKLIHAPKAVVWEKLADFGNVSIFHPMVEHSALLNNQQCGLGATRSCTFYDGKSVEEKITDWQEGRSLTIAITRGDMPVKSANIRMSLHNAGSNTTRVRIDGEFAMKSGIADTIIGPLMMKPMMRKMLGDVLKGLDAHCQTGKKIGKGGALLESN